MARERALSLLYEADSKEREAGEILTELPVEPDAYARMLVEGVAEHVGDLDEVIARFARDWSLERMPTIDLILLRLGVYELSHRDDVPTGVVLSEMVDLARSFSTDGSGKFVNGVLARIAEEVRSPTGTANN